MWILLIFFSASSVVGGVAVDHVEYSSYGDCISAKNALTLDWAEMNPDLRQHARVFAVCTAKGSGKNDSE